MGVEIRIFSDVVVLVVVVVVVVGDDECTTVHLQIVLQLVSLQLSCLYQVHISSSSENSSLQSFYFSHLPAFSSHISSPSTLGTFSPTILPLSTSGLSAPTTLPPLLFSDT